MENGINHTVIIQSIEGSKIGRSRCLNRSTSTLSVSNFRANAVIWLSVGAVYLKKGIERCLQCWIFDFLIYFTWYFFWFFIKFIIKFGEVHKNANHGIYISKLIILIGHTLGNILVRLYKRFSDNCEHLRNNRSNLVHFCRCGGAHVSIKTYVSANSNCQVKNSTWT